MHESIIDDPRRSLDPQLFNVEADPTTILPEVRGAILKLASEYSKWARVADVYLIGSILTKQWNADTDLDVTLIAVKGDETAWAAAREYAGQTQDTVVIPGTQHPINFFIRDDWDPSMADQMMDVINNTWITQTDVAPISIDDYIDNFQILVKQIDLVKGELSRDIVDYNYLQNYSKDEIKGLESRVSGKLDEIDAQVKELAGTYKIIHALRKMSFSQPMTPEELKQYQIKNKLPANVIYKLLSRYHYIKFLSAIRQALKGASGAIDEPKDVAAISTAVSASKVTDADVEDAITEITCAGGAGGYDVPLGTTPVGRKRKRKKKRKLVGV